MPAGQWGKPHLMHIDSPQSAANSSTTALVNSPVATTTTGSPSGAVAGGPQQAEIEGLLHTVSDRSDATLRDPTQPLRPAKGSNTLIIPRQIIERFRIRQGALVSGVVRGRTIEVRQIEGKPVNGNGPQASETNTLYESAAIDPQPRMKLEHDPAELTTRTIDLLTPVGFGQRGLLTAPPRVGKTMLLQNIARGVHANYPNVELILLLIDERPEEVTDMKRNVPGTVFASSNDNDIAKHLDLAQLVIERCKRRVELGHDVVVLLDSLTRLGRAFNSGSRGSGRTMSGGLDSKALEVPKRLFGAARKIENGGSLTVLATCLIETGSRMDDIIFEEFKGTGNMELTLDRKLAEQRLYPAINIAESGTRKEELLWDPKHFKAAQNVRRHLVGMQPTAALRTLQEVMKRYKTNDELLASIRSE